MMFQIFVSRTSVFLNLEQLKMPEKHVFWYATLLGTPGYLLGHAFIQSDNHVTLVLHYWIMQMKAKSVSYYSNQISECRTKYDLSVGLVFQNLMIWHARIYTRNKPKKKYHVSSRFKDETCSETKQRFPLQ